MRPHAFIDIARQMAFEKMLWYETAGFRLGLGVLSAAAVAFVWFLSFWNLLGWRF